MGSSHKKKTLFDDDEEYQNGSLKVNTSFAKRFEVCNRCMLVEYTSQVMGGRVSCAVA